MELFSKTKTTLSDRKKTGTQQATWQYGWGDEYILSFLFAISSSPGLTFTIKLL
jgi:hypothetical protein